MPPLLERNQIGKRESLADIISCVESEEAPFSSQIPKRPRPINNIHDWQLKQYKIAGHKGVLDNQDATEFGHNTRARVHAVGQKVWDNPAISDFADEATVAGIGKGEMAEQISDSIVSVKHITERRGLSDGACQIDNGIVPYETRGMFLWIDDSEQAVYPVPEAYRTPAASIHTGTLAAMTETAFKTMCRSAYKQRKGPHSLDGYVGIDLKAKVTEWTVLQPDVGSHTMVRTFNHANSRTIMSTVDMLNLDTGKIRLHPDCYILTDADDGTETDYTHRSGIFLDMRMVWLAYVRKPRVRKLEDQGGGPRAIVDSIFMFGCDNPGGQMKAYISEDS